MSTTLKIDFKTLRVVILTRKFETFDDYRRHLKNKYGRGEGADYKPWVTVRDVKDKNAFRKLVEGIKTNRQHHFLSSIEAQLFYLLEFRDDVVDIREQFPLIPLEVSQKIASVLGIKHPKVPITGIPNIMTTDILITIENKNNISYHAFCIKPKEKLNNLRVLEKIEIERVWWELLNIPFSIFTGNKVTEIQSANIAWATDPYRSNTYNHLEKFLEPAAAMLSVGKQLKYDICNSFLEAFDIQQEDALNILRILIAKKFISVNMDSLIENSLSINIESLTYQYWKISVEY